MKTPVELSDDLYRQAKAEAALRGRKLRELVEEGLRLVIQSPRNQITRPTLRELMENACGVVDSGIPDLASNPKYLAGFGRHAIADTGPLVALLDRAERHHAWVVERVAELEAPLLVCEPVLAETMYLLARLPKA
jgi:hypothetical protein